MRDNIKKIVLVDESIPINTRNTKILDSLALSFPNAEIHVISWDRENKYQEDSSDKHYHLFKRPAKYGNKVQKLFGLFGFRKYCCAEINDINPDIIIASRWNNLLMLPSLRKNQMLIYENLDTPTGPLIGRKFVNFIEHYYMNKAALTIHASRFYTHIYPKKYPQLVLENKLAFQTPCVDYAPQTPLRIALLGNIRYFSILKTLVDAVKDDNRFQLYFHGYGPDYETLKEYTQSSTNIHCTGEYKYEDMGNLYSESDLSWAAYPNKDFKVKYDISNKFYDSIAYTIPAVYSEQTMLGDYVDANKIGFKINPYSVEAIKDLLNGFVSDKTRLSSVHDNLVEFKRHETTWNEDFKKLESAILQFFEKTNNY